MQLAFTHDYVAGPSEVVELFRNEDFIADLAKHAGALSHEASIAPDSTTLAMKLATPGNVAKLIGKTIDLTMRFAFREADADGRRQGTVDVAVPGMPIDVAAAIAVSPTPSGSRGDYSGQLNVKIPLVGKKVESQIEPFIRQAFDAVERRANHWLTRG